MRARSASEGEAGRRWRDGGRCGDDYPSLSSPTPSHHPHAHVPWPFRSPLHRLQLTPSRACPCAASVRQLCAGASRARVYVRRAAHPACVCVRGGGGGDTLLIVSSRAPWRANQSRALACECQVARPCVRSVCVCVLRAVCVTLCALPPPCARRLRSAMAALRTWGTKGHPSTACERGARGAGRGARGGVTPSTALGERDSTKVLGVCCV